MAWSLKIGLGPLLLLLFYTENAFSMWTEFELRSIENMNGSDAEPAVINLRAKRLKKGLYGIAGTVVMNDFFFDYETSITVYHSATGNNNFRPSPIAIPRGPSCGKANVEYRKTIMNDVHAYSDLPYTEDTDADICAMFEKGKTFTLRNYEVNSNIIPKFLMVGLYKFHLTIFKKGSQVMTTGLEILFNLS